MPQAPAGAGDTLEPPEPARSPALTLDDDERVEAPAPVTRLRHYVLLHELGRGGMGVVHAAYDEKLGRKVAIKVLRTRGNAATQRRLVREAQGLARLSSPNVVQIYEIGEVEGQAFLAMELIDGLTLRAWHDERHRSHAEVLAVLTAAGRGLAAAHAKGLVHRDFKPDNVMIHRDGRVLVTDFGLVRERSTADAPTAPMPTTALTEDLTQVGAVVGTPGYMPPEQFAGRETDARSDQFSFCASAWELLYGKRPFTGADPKAIEEAVLAGKLDEPTPSSVPAWLREVLARGLACEPSARWPTMDELLAALARDPTPRRRALLAGGGALVLAIAAGSWANVSSARQRSAQITACEQLGRAIESDWDAATVATLEQAFLATGTPSAASSWAHARPWMDDYAREWAALRTRTCMETHVEQRRDEASYAAVTACLDERRAAFAGVLDVWAGIDRTTLRMAATGSAGLPPLSLCMDEAHLARLARPPAEIRPQVIALQLRLERIKARRLAGDYEAALIASEALLPEALELDWLPLTAQIRLEIGFDLAELGQYERARAAVEQSFLDATRSGDELGMLGASTKLSHTVGNLMGEIERGHYWGKIAFGLIAHLGMEGSIAEASLHNSVGSIDLEDAAYEPALAHYRQARLIYESALGPRHPAVATSLNNIASALRLAGQHADSLEPYAQALELRETAMGADHPAVGYPLHGLGLSYLALGDHAKARAFLERAVALREQTGEPAKLAGSRFGLAKVLWAVDERAQAHALAGTARAGFRAAGPGSQEEVERVETWLREHPLPAGSAR